MAGRKAKYTDPAEMQAVIDAYFKACEGEILLNDEGDPVLDRQGLPIRVNEKPPTVSGLALALGLSSRKSLLHYQGRKKFADTVKRARLRVEEYNEQRLYDKDGRQGAEFSLCHNFRWMEEEQKEEQSAGGVVLMPNIQDEG